LVAVDRKPPSRNIRPLDCALWGFHKPTRGVHEAPIRDVSPSISGFQSPVLRPRNPICRQSRIYAYAFPWSPAFRGHSPRAPRAPRPDQAGLLFVQFIPGRNRSRAIVVAGKVKTYPSRRRTATGLRGEDAGGAGTGMAVPPEGRRGLCHERPRSQRPPKHVPHPRYSPLRRGS
jgi:hypothetical protein